MDDDEELMRQITMLAEYAARVIPTNQNISVLAAVLAEHFDHRTEQDIKEQLRAVWRARGLFYDE